MKKEARTIYALLIAVAAVVSFVQFAPKAHAASWTFFSSITVTSTPTIASGTNVNFPMLVSSTESYWKSATNGGTIQNLVTAPNGGQEPADLVFATSSANCTAGSYLNFETESYSSSTGALIDWVNVPTVSTGTVIFACYDASAVTSDQSHPSSTWNSNYLAVYHLNQGGLATTTDSTKNNFNGANISVAASSSPFGGSTLFMGSTSSFIGVPSVYGGPTSTLTIEGWGNSVAGTGILGFAYMGYTPSACFEGVAMSPWGGVGTSTSFGVLSTQSGFYCGAGVNEVGYQNLFSQSGWHQFVDTFSAPANLIALYTNATLNVTTTASKAIFYGSATTTIGIGANSAFTQYATNGEIAELRFSNVALTPSWILTQYNNQASPDAAQSSTGFYAVGAQTSFGGGVSGEGNAIVSLWGIIVTGLSLL